MSNDDLINAARESGADGAFMGIAKDSGDNPEVYVYFAQDDGYSALCVVFVDGKPERIDELDRDDAEFEIGGAE